MTSIITIQKEKAFKDVLKINKNRKKRMTLYTETENCMKEFVIENRLNCFCYSCFKK